jgi:hypothetical protein
VTESEAAAILSDNAAAYAAVALANIAREFPSVIWHVTHAPDDLPGRPRERTPVFWGSFDWHSCVEMHWLLARLLRTVPDRIPAEDVRSALDRQLRPEGLAAEAAFIAHPDNRNAERPYGWGWALALVHELATWADPDARRWASAAAPLAEAVTGNFLDWLPRATYPIRYGVHGNSAFGLGLALPYATARADAGDPRLADAIATAAQRWFAADADYPAAWEPSGHDFLSPALVEAELMSRLLPPEAFSLWLAGFLPGIAVEHPATLFTPVIVSDETDGHIAHLHGLNLSRAWAWRRLAAALLADDPRAAVALRAAHRHADAALPHVVGGDYMVEHWLPAYAVLLLT